MNQDKRDKLVINLVSKRVLKIVSAGNGSGNDPITTKIKVNNWSRDLSEEKLIAKIKAP
tara:strand:- start:577 stop:753 length:177 start_codon:yes stop_codon:yes gene_type:complete